MEGMKWEGSGVVYEFVCSVRWFISACKVQHGRSAWEWEREREREIGSSGVRIVKG